MTPFNPDDWLDILGLIIVTAGPVVAAWIAIQGHRKQNRTLGAIEGQVTNKHGDRNLRTDIDRVLEGIADIRDRQKRQGEDIGELRKDIGGLRSELRTEREERIEGDRQRGR